MFLLLFKIRSPKETDETIELLTLAASNPDVIGNLQFSPHVKFVVYTQCSLEHIQEMCTVPGNLLSVLQIDKTFKIGDFFVTSTCYQFGKVRRRDNGKRPWIPGPAVFHIKEDQSIHSHLASTMKQKNPAMKNILLIGMDREKAISNGLLAEVPFANLLYCKKHMEDDISLKMSRLKLDSLAKKIILQDIFGNSSSQVMNAFP